MYALWIRMQQFVCVCVGGGGICSYARAWFSSEAGMSMLEAYSPTLLSTELFAPLVDGLGIFSYTCVHTKSSIKHDSDQNN